jgi:DNA/RNA-binding domain of Phe-tRNA-synthetase-like protein
VMTFQYDSEIVTRFPNLSSGVILVEGLSNGDTPENLQSTYLAEQRATLARIDQTPLSQLVPLEAWREAFRRFGVDPTKYRSASESLLRRLTKKGDIPVINCLVDLGNLVSIRYGLPVAAFDTRDLQGAVTVRLAKGTERFTPLFETEVENPEPGEVIFSDEADLVLARRWCWRQADQSAARPDTRNVIMTVEAQHAGGQSEVEAALNDLLNLLRQYTGGQFTWGILNANRPIIQADAKPA